MLEGWLHLSINMGDLTNEQVEAITNAANQNLYVRIPNLTSK